jgi:PAS domain S-box-containing protein
LSGFYFFWALTFLLYPCYNTLDLTVLKRFKVNSGEIVMDAEEIRQHARKLLQQGYPIREVMGEQDLKKIVEELQIHQIELELQNEELMRTQQTLDQTQRKYLDLYNHAPVGYITFDQNGIILEMNLTASQMLGEPRRRLVGRTLTPYLTNDSIVVFYRHCHTVATQVDSAKRWECDLTLRSEDSKLPKHIQLESVAAVEDDSQQVRVRSAMIDITEQKLTAEQLRLSEHNWAALVNNTTDWIWAIDQDLKLLTANSAFREYIFTQKGYLLQPGVDVLRATPTDERTKWQSYYNRVLQGEQLRVEFGEGSEVYEASFNPITDGTDISGVVIYVHNVSERNSMEQALRQRNRELGMFAHNVAQDLQNPLNMIIGYADYIIKHGAFFNQDEPSQIGNKIKDAALNTSDIIDELLFLAGLQHTDVTTVEIDMQVVLERVLERLSSKIAEQQAVVSLPDKLLPAMGYEPWVEKIWLNIITLALEYGGRSPRFQIGSNLQNGTLVQFRIKGGGHDMPAHKAGSPSASVLWPEDTSVDQYGLGLSVVKGILGRLNGQIGTRGGAEQQLEFFFTLPQPPG